MSHGNSRQITSNQTGPSDKIVDLVTKHLAHPSQKPFNQHTLDAFEQTQLWLENRKTPIILDACCGVGESTAVIASQFPDCSVIGVDKSALRTGKHQHYAQGTDNYIVVRADLNDFWRLARKANWKLFKHFLLYPNPYPKAAQVQRRWHASAAFADILALAGEIEVRSNWKIYIQEFALALTTAGFKSDLEEYRAEQPTTPFERKYWASGQQSWRVLSNLNIND